MLNEHLSGFYNFIVFAFVNRLIHEADQKRRSGIFWKILNKAYINKPVVDAGSGGDVEIVAVLTGVGKANEKRLQIDFSAVNV